MKRQYPSDLRPIVKKCGTGFIAGYRTPGRTRTLMQNGRPEKFATETEAEKAAMMALCTEYRDTCLGYVTTPLRGARKAAEELFKKPARSE